MPSSHASSDQAPDRSMSQGVLLTQIFCVYGAFQGAFRLWASLHVSRVPACFDN